MIHFLKGDIFDAGTDAIVNPVNCVGVMGAGLAGKFKVCYPYNFIRYKEACKRKKLKIGAVYTVLVPGSAPRSVINFPTKIHWLDRSSMRYIHLGLEALVKEITTRQFKSVAIPKLGCGLGGLSWGAVKPVVVKALSGLKNCDILIYE